ncbi:MAG TPA: tail fiber domain-containing protein, partial [Pyrinomonadaceae bacterium]|nr:tail fiber domain-containing protein [Pyrinomonadaceae bacterium]
KICLVSLLLLIAAGRASAQTTAFTYQGQLTDGGTSANGNYDLQFALFDSASSGTQIGSTQTVNTVAVSSGVFTVTLDFGGNAFSGANRFLEISARLSGAGSFTLLTPRQQLTSIPYAVRSLSASSADTATNATQLGGVAAASYVQTNDSRLSDPRAPATGSANYIQNGTSQQAGSNFNVSGNGSAGGTLSGNVVNATTQYNINGNRVLLSNTSSSNLFAGVAAANPNTTGTANSFFGQSAGNGDTTGQANSFFGASAGFSNTTGSANSFFGFVAGSQNTTGVFNSFFGSQAGTLATGNSNSFFGNQAGTANTTASYNSFFGDVAGYSNTTGNSNSFFGQSAGKGNISGSNNAFFGTIAGNLNTTGGSNSFFGEGAGSANSSGNSNAFFGTAAGHLNTMGSNNAFFGTSAGNFSNTTGSNNTLIGSVANLGADDLTNATAIGARAQVSQSNSLVLGSISGVNFSAADTNVGIGTTTPTERLTIKTPTARYGFIHTDGAITVGSYVGGGGGGWYGTKSNHPLNLFVNDGNPSLTIDTGGIVSITTLAAGSTSLCRTASNQISNCSSSLRYKTAVQPFLSGLGIINRLRPISFTWKQDGTRDLGFGAEDVAAIEPLLATHNARGEIEGVKYDRLTAVLVNAIKDQQQQIQQQQNTAREQQQEITRQHIEIQGLKRLLCTKHSRAKVCRPDN